MDWLTQYWPYLIAGALLVVLVARVAVVLLPKYRQPVRHSGERTIRVIGVGGAGGNAVDHMIRAKQRGVDYIAVNTDAQVLDDSLAPRRVQIGEQLTQGLGAGGDAAIGRQAAEEDADEINRMVGGSDLVFIAAGLGGGTGSGAAPVIAAQAQRVGALTVGVVTRPFEFEGSGRRKIADAAEAELKANVDTLLLIENERVLSVVGEDTSMLDAFTFVNEVLAGTVRAVVDIMTVPGLINLDFADVRAIMQDGGMATAGIGAAVGPERAVVAAHAAVANPLLNHDLAGAGAILLNVAGASGMTMREVTQAAEVIRSAADPEAMIIFGTIFDDHLDDELRVTVIATRLRDDFAYVSRVASDARSIAEPEEQEEPAPAAAVAAIVAAAAAVQPEVVEPEGVQLEDEDEEEPRWAAIPIVTSGEEPVAVVASGATAAAEYAAEPLAPWAASQAYTTSVEPAPAEESAAPAEQSWIAPAEEAAGPESTTPAEESWSAPADESPGLEPLADAAFAPSEPDEAAAEAPAEQAFSAPADEAVDEESAAEPWAAAATLAATTFAQSEPDQTVSALEPAQEPVPSQPALSAQPYEALDSGRWSAAAALAATTFAQSEPDQTVSEVEPIEEMAPAEPAKSALPDAPEPEPWAAAAALAATTFAQSEPDQTVSALEPGQTVSELAPIEEPALAEQSWFAPAEGPEPAIAGQPWFAPAGEAQADKPDEPSWSGEADEAPAEQSWVASSDEAPEPVAPEQSWVASSDEAPEPAAAEQSWVASSDEAPEPVAAEQSWSAIPEPPQGEPSSAAPVLASADEEPEPAAAEQSWVASSDEAPEPAAAEQSWVASSDEAEEPQDQPIPAAASWFAPAEEGPTPIPAGERWFASTDEAAETEPSTAAWVAPAEEAQAPAASAAAWADPAHGDTEPEQWAATPAPAPEEPEVAAPEPERPDAAAAVERQPWAALGDATPSDPVADRPEAEPAHATPKFLIQDEPAPASETVPLAEPVQPAQPPWYTPGDESLEAARSAAAPAITPPDTPVPASPPESPKEAPASHPPGRVIVSRQAAPRAQQPPPSQLARRTTQAVLLGVWKRLQKPPPR